MEDFGPLTLFYYLSEFMGESFTSFSYPDELANCSIAHRGSARSVGFSMVINKAPLFLWYDCCEESSFSHLGVVLCSPTSVGVVMFDLQRL